MKSFKQRDGSCVWKRNRPSDTIYYSMIIGISPLREEAIVYKMSEFNLSKNI